MKYVVIFCIVLTLLYPITRNEMIKYMHTHGDCQRQNIANLELIYSGMCQNPERRLQFKTAGTVDCDRAERELRLSAHQCAFQSWWHQSEIVRVWTTLTHSYWTLVGILLPLSMWAMLLVYWHWRAHSTELLLYEKQAEFARTLLGPFKPAGKERKRDRVRMLDQPAVHADTTFEVDYTRNRKGK